MTSFRIRPRFKIHSNKSPKEIQERIQKRLITHPEDCIGRVIPNHIILRIPFDQRHFWSPQLSLNLEVEDNQTVISGLYGPNPNVWALFSFGYGTVGVLFLFISIIGSSKLSLGKSAPILWVLPILAFIAVVLYLFSQVGQKLGVEETFTIHHFLEEVLEQKISIV